MEYEIILKFISHHRVLSIRALQNFLELLECKLGFVESNFVLIEMILLNLVQEHANNWQPLGFTHANPHT